ncbi:uncharacterized protein LOC131989178 [Centropristis striata]|uniref:uncharacterized protein LOC131989178 n=1 Tax=Centropristis striata TaxID=184440 RepID=UPI0027E17F9F|nr:uncharacterized protein LOC131989178 [Centropristis striata]
MTTCETDTPCVSSRPVLVSEPQMNEAASSEDTDPQMTTCETDTPCVSSRPVLVSEPQMNEAASSEDTDPEMPTCETDTPCVSSRPVLMSEPQMNEVASSEDTDPQMTTCETDTPCVSSRPVLMSEPQMNEAASSEDTDPQMTTCETDTPCVSSRPVLVSEPQMNEAASSEDTDPQMTTCETDTPCVSSRPVLVSEPQMNEAASSEDTDPQMTTCETDTPCVSSRPVLMSEPQMNEAASSEDTDPQMTTCEIDTPCVSSRPVLVSEPQMNKAASSEDADPQMTTCETDTPCVSSRPVLMSEPQMEEAASSEYTDPQAEPRIPRLRRTKSIIMKDPCLEDCELYDSTSGSEEEYVPDTTSESEDSDASLNIQQATRKSYDNPLSDHCTMLCDTTTPDVDNNSSTCEITAEEEPCAIQDPSDVVVGAFQKNNGKRVYNKRHHCVYCSKPYAKMARHLESVHYDKRDVAKAISFPKGSKERKRQLDYIRNRGNYAHNATVIEKGKGQLVPFKRPPKQAQGVDFLHCVYCQGLFIRKTLWRHMRNCRLKPASQTPKPGQNRVQALCTYAGPLPLHMNKLLWKVVSVMNPDSITDIIKHDKVIMDVGQHLLSKGGMTAKNEQCVREKMRELGRLVVNARKVTQLKKLEDFINPENYLQMVKAVKFTCGYDSETNTFAIPSLATKLGHSLVKVSKLLKAQGLISNNKELVKHATEFQDVHKEKWNALISATALRNLAEAKWNAPTLMPFTEDVQKLHQFLDKMQEEHSSTLSESPSTKAWTDLAKVCLTQIILFNRRREGEVASMPLHAFLTRDRTDPHQDLDWALSEVEKKLCRHFTRIVTRGKRGRPVPILLTPKMLRALELLVDQRIACGVLKDNIFVFARPEALSHLRGSDCMRVMAGACEAKCPKALTSTKLRKHAATLSTVLNMTDTEMDQLANFLGHDIRIHREFYRLPDKTLQLAKISKVLMALEQGRLVEFHGKNLDEIDIDPNEEVLGRGEEDWCREEENCSSTLHEPSEHETVADTEENQIPPEQKRCTLPPAEDGASSGVSALRNSSQETSEEENVADTEGNKIPPKQKRRKLPPAEDGSSGVSAVRHSSKGKASCKRTPWQPAEVKAVERHMSALIRGCTVPSKMECEKCLRAEPEALKNRDWQNLKFFVYNRITAYKRKMLFK